MVVFIEKYSTIIKRNKEGINEYMKQFNMKGLGYVIDSNILKIMLELLLMY